MCADEEKTFNIKANPAATSRHTSNKYPAPQAAADMRQHWFSISKLLSSSMHGKYRASMWNNPEIKTRRQEYLLASLCIYRDTLKIGEFQSEVPVQDFVVSKKHDMEQRQPQEYPQLKTVGSQG